METTVNDGNEIGMSKHVQRGARPGSIDATEDSSICQAAASQAITPSNPVRRYPVAIPCAIGSAPVVVATSSVKPRPLLLPRRRERDRSGRQIEVQGSSLGGSQ